MSLRPIFLTAVTSAERQITTDAIRQIIGNVGGWIDDFALYSNISVMIRAMLPASAVAEFGRQLSKLDLKIDDGDIIALAQAQSENSDEFSCTLNVTFFHDEPDLRRVVPAVPG